MPPEPILVEVARDLRRSAVERHDGTGVLYNNIPADAKSAITYLLDVIAILKEKIVKL